MSYVVGQVPLLNLTSHIVVVVVGQVIVLEEYPLPAPHLSMRGLTSPTLPHPPKLATGFSGLKKITPLPLPNP